MTEKHSFEPLAKETPKTDYDLIIVGGGIVGATLASALKTSHLNILMIEAQPLEQVVTRRQAYALSIMTGRIFQGIGVWDKIFPHIGKFNHIRLSDAQDARVVKFNTADLKTDFLGYVGEHQVIASALQDFLKDAPHINILSPAEVTEIDSKQEQALITVKFGQETRKIAAKLVIGADGARSHLRTLAGIKTKGWKYWQSCVAFTIQHQAPENNIAFERFWTSGPMGILPLPDNRCQIVWSAPHAQAKAIQELSERDFLAQLYTRTGGLLGELQLVSDRRLFPVQLMQSDHYVKPRLALAGDAAHCCHPVGGQGLNLGIRDAAALAQILTEAAQKREDIGDIEVLKRYERWRKRENLTILGVTDFLDRFFSNDWFPIVLVRRLGLSLMNHLPPLKIFALEIMTGLKGKTPQLAQD